MGDSSNPLTDGFLETLSPCPTTAPTSNSEDLIANDNGATANGNDSPEDNDIYQDPLDSLPVLSELASATPNEASFLAHTDNMSMAASNTAALSATTVSSCPLTEASILLNKQPQSRPLQSGFIPIALLPIKVENSIYK